MSSTAFTWLPVAFGLTGDFLVNFVGWAVSSYLKSDLLYDLLGAASHVLCVILALVGATQSGLLTTRVSFAAALIGLWAIRLGSFLFTRILETGGDERLDKYKKSPGKFAIVWFMQSLWVAINCSPFLALLGNSAELNKSKAAAAAASAEGLSLYDLVVLAAWTTGFLLEVVADQQKKAFRQDRANKDRFINTGLWSRSRHPNFFGEILMWASFAAFCAPGLNLAGTQGLLLLAPCFPAWLLLKVSGVPLLESKAKRRWGEEPEYRRYVQTTPVLVPKLW